MFCMSLLTHHPMWLCADLSKECRHTETQPESTEKWNLLLQNRCAESDNNITKSAKKHRERYFMFSCYFHKTIRLSQKRSMYN